MSEPIPAETLRTLAAADRIAYLEQRLFVLSPFGTLATACLVFALLAGSFVAIALASHLPLVVRDGAQTTIQPALRFALWMSLLFAAILGIQRHVRKKEREDFVALAAILRDGAAGRGRSRPPDAHRREARRANVIGLIAGLAASWFFFFADEPRAELPARPAFSPGSRW